MENHQGTSRNASHATFGAAIGDSKLQHTGLCLGKSIQIAICFLAEASVLKLRVTNGCAERGVTLVEEYNKILTADEEQKQFLILDVKEHRKRYPNVNKTTLDPDEPLPVRQGGPASGPHAPATPPPAAITINLIGKYIQGRSCSCKVSGYHFCLSCLGVSHAIV
ncbi:Alpha-1,3-mannosyl-glycoprotein 2-beta-N-acetylglucosaminyltransferase [Frankliniella fusca]|uniref:Alpha-1,3-mannosyl-glycoprotein 2-beta-N-acetylglucosaminyltransferase n=1 Tax=Frankliniella fusca TaxID=407009 RepID=A0AAE1HC42_9NEOP|nr:Alpha-1,3-mannosyl-glycoprotein 2-beta-N-acetylglucosaminyltransferase [Frankliniella fusca]